MKAILKADDPVIAHGLNSRVKYVRIVRRKLKGRNRFYAQLVCEGLPYHKPEHAVGVGTVGLDLGPASIAAVGDERAFLAPFCAELVSRQREIGSLQRQIERQRRANNPQNDNPDGTIRFGPKVWQRSARQRRTEAKLAELHRKQAAYRQRLHGQMVHRVLGMGAQIQTEKRSYRRFGRSVGMSAPGAFVAHLKRKAERAGAQVVEFSTHTTRLSQVCHQCGRVARKPLSQRWLHKSAMAGCGYAPPGGVEPN